MSGLHLCLDSDGLFVCPQKCKVQRHQWPDLEPCNSYLLNETQLVKFPLLQVELGKHIWFIFSLWSIGKLPASTPRIANKLPASVERLSALNSLVMVNL